VANITIRNIPDDLFEKIRRLSSVEKRSINSELLLIIERGTSVEMAEIMAKANHIPKSIQINLWRSLSKGWKDSRSTEKIIDEIYSARTTGREFEL
jgi:hypothetical protein